MFSKKSTPKPLNIAFPADLLNKLKQRVPRREWNQFIIKATEQSLERTLGTETPPPEKSANRRWWPGKKVKSGAKTKKDTLLANAIERVNYRQLWRGGLLAAALATVSNVGLYLLGSFSGISFQIPVGAAGPQPITLTTVVIVSVAAAGGAAALLAFLGLPYVRWWTPRPSRVLWSVAAFVLLMSLGGPLSLPAATPGKQLLMVMHVVTAVIIVSVLSVSSFKR
jgi:hypothetical protein